MGRRHLELARCFYVHLRGDSVLAMMANRCPDPSRIRVAFSSSPSAFAYSPLPSASISTLSPTPPDLPRVHDENVVHGQAMVSTPFALSWSAISTKPGKCLALQRECAGDREEHHGLALEQFVRGELLRPVLGHARELACRASYRQL